MKIFRDANIRGKQSGIKSTAMIDQVHERARTLANKYNIAREARLKLGWGDWEKQFRVLLPTDIRLYADPERVRHGPGRQGVDEEGAGPTVGGGDANMAEIDVLREERSRRDGTGQMRTVVSWIWQSSQICVNDNADERNDILRSEWCRSRAWAAQWTEEVHRIREEM